MIPKMRHGFFVLFTVGYGVFIPTGGEQTYFFIGHTASSPHDAVWGST